MTDKSIHTSITLWLAQLVENWLPNTAFWVWSPVSTCRMAMTAKLDRVDFLCPLYIFSIRISYIHHWQCKYTAHQGKLYVLCRSLCTYTRKQSGNQKPKQNETKQIMQSFSRFHYSINREKHRAKRDLGKKTPLGCISQINSSFMNESAKQARHCPSRSHWDISHTCTKVSQSIMHYCLQFSRWPCSTVPKQWNA